MTAEFKPHKSKGRWFWTLVETGNHKNIALGGEPFPTVQHVDNAIANVTEEVGHLAYPKDKFLILRRTDWLRISERISDEVHNGVDLVNLIGDADVNQ